MVNSWDDIFDRIFSSGGRSAGHVGPTIRSEPYEYQVPTTTIGATPYDKDLGEAHLCNCTLVETSGTAPATVILTDQYGFPHNYTLVASAPLQIKRAICKRLQISGAGAIVAGYLTWPEEVSPESILVAGTTNVGIVSSGTGTALVTTSVYTLTATPTQYYILTNTSANQTWHIREFSATVTIGTIDTVIEDAINKIDLAGNSIPIRLNDSTTFPSIESYYMAWTCEGQASGTSYAGTFAFTYPNEIVLLPTESLVFFGAWTSGGNAPTIKLAVSYRTVPL